MGDRCLLANRTAAGKFFFRKGSCSHTAEPRPSFSPVSAAMTGTRLGDPCIFHDGTNLYVVATQSSTDSSIQRWLRQTQHSGVSWSDPKNVSYGGNGTTRWWEYSPVGNYSAGNVNLFFTTESDGNGEIAYIKMNWDLTYDHYFYIKNAVDQASSGDIVNIAAGTYDEQVLIKRSLTLQGAGATTIIKPSSKDRLTIKGNGWYGDGYNKDVRDIIVANTTAGSNVIVKSLKVDGASVTSKPVTADFLAGIFYNKTGGTIDTVTVTNIRIDTSTPGYGIYISNSSDPTTVEIKSSTITNYGRTGIDSHGPKLTVNIHDNTLTGRGPLPSVDETQIGLAVQDGATGTLERNIISNHIFTPETHWAAGIVFNGSSGSALSNTITNCQIGIAFQDSNGAASTNTVSGAEGKVGLHANYTKAGRATISFTSNTVSGSDSWGVGVATYDLSASPLVTIDNNQLTGGPGDGVRIGVSGQTGNITATISNCVISSWQHGINLVSSISTVGRTIIKGCTIQNNLGAGSGIHNAAEVAPTNIWINFNNIFGNTGAGVYGASNGYAGDLNATYNWWGSASGPSGSGPGTGDAVSTGVSFIPWLTTPTYTMTVSYSIVGDGSGYSVPIFHYTKGGLSNNYALTLTPTDILVDKNSPWNVTNPLGGSGTTEQWNTTQPTSGTVSSSQTINFAYRHQYPLRITSAHGTTTGAGWKDAGASATFSVTSPVNGTAGVRYLCTNYTGAASGSGSSGTVTMDVPKTITFNWKTQYYLRMQASPATGGSVSPGSSWKDEGTSVSISATPNEGFKFQSWTGSGTGSYTGKDVDRTLTMNNPINQTANFYGVVTMTVSYQVVGGGTGYFPPLFAYLQNGTDKTYTLTTTPTGIPVDAGFTWSVSPNPLTGSSEGERWFSAQELSGTATTATIVFKYYRQYPQSLTVPFGSTTTVGSRSLGVSAEVNTFIGNPKVTVATYPSNPGDTSIFKTLGKYVDVQISSAKGVNWIVIRVYYDDADLAAAGVDESTLVLYWWNGASWVECPDLHVDAESNCVWVKITDTSIPTLSQLTGTVFGTGGSETTPTPPPTTPPPTTPSPTPTYPPATSPPPWIQLPGGQKICIIATATYGSALAPEVVYMRHVRDNMIASNEVGRTIVNGWNTFYYSWSTPLALWIASSDALQSTFRVLLLPLVAIVHLTAFIYAAIATINLALASVIAFSTAAILSVASYIIAPVLTLRTIYRKKHIVRFLH